MNNDLREQVASDIFGELGFTNGWKIDDAEYERLCDKLADELITLIRTATLDEVKPTYDMEKLRITRMKLKQGDYDGTDIMRAWLAVDALMDVIEAIDNLIGESDE